MMARLAFRSSGIMSRQLKMFSLLLPPGKQYYGRFHAWELDRSV